MPKTCPEVDSNLLDPANLWTDKAAYEAQAKMLAQKFEDNFARFNEIPNHFADRQSANQWSAFQS